MTEWLGKLYEKLWRKIGGRPWTEIVRDEQKQSPLLFLLIFLGLGILAGKPIINLGPGENCFGLDKLLSHRDINERHLEAVREWLKERQR